MVDGGSLRSRWNLFPIMCFQTASSFLLIRAPVRVHSSLSLHRKLQKFEQHWGNACLHYRSYVELAPSGLPPTEICTRGLEVENLHRPISRLRAWLLAKLSEQVRIVSNIRFEANHEYVGEMLLKIAGGRREHDLHSLQFKPQGRQYP